MPTACKYICGRMVDVDFFQSDTCQNIDTKEKYHIILLEKGSLTLNINHQVITFTSPCVITLKENLAIDFISSQILSAKTIRFDVSFLNVNISYEMINSGQYEKNIEEYGFVPLNVFYQTTDYFSYFLPLSKDTYLQMDRLFFEFYSTIYSQTDVRWSCRARLHLNRILKLLYQINAGYLKQNITVCNIKKAYMWVAFILEWIHNHYREHVSLDSLSKLIHINRTTVAKYFKEIVGCSVTDCIIRYRIQCACYSLSTTNLNVKEIARACGFSSEAYFIKQLRTRLGPNSCAI